MLMTGLTDTASLSIRCSQVWPVLPHFNAGVVDQPTPGGQGRAYLGSGDFAHSKLAALAGSPRS